MHQRIDDLFFKRRAEFIERSFEGNRSQYNELVVNELAKVREIDPTSDINLWFENDLFCQTNLWFILKYLRNAGRDRNLFRILPEKWAGFGRWSASELKHGFVSRIALNSDDVSLGIELWNAFSHSDIDAFFALSQTPSVAFPHLDEVVLAHIQRSPVEGEGRPQRVLRELVASGVTDFPTLFQRFTDREAIYGFGDVQVRNILKTITRR